KDRIHIAKETVWIFFFISSIKTELIYFVKSNSCCEHLFILRASVSIASDFNKKSTNHIDNQLSPL
ncbi:hypothetical protein EEK45_21220, partial [Salmonella enterica]|nr:hypothetical protein [Salmonella enterica]